MGITRDQSVLLYSDLSYDFDIKLPYIAIEGSNIPVPYKEIPCVYMDSCINYSLFRCSVDNLFVFILRITKLNIVFY